MKNKLKILFLRGIPWIPVLGIVWVLIASNHIIRFRGRIGILPKDLPILEIVFGAIDSYILFYWGTYQIFFLSILLNLPL